VASGGGGDTILLGNSSGTVSLSGTNNDHVGGYDANETITGGGNGLWVLLGNGNDSVTAIGTGIEIGLGDGNDTVNLTSTDAPGQMFNGVDLGRGQDNVHLTGTSVQLYTGGNNSTVDVAGSNNLISSNWTTGDQWSDEFGSSNNTFDHLEGSANLTIRGSSDSIYMNFDTVSIADEGAGLQLFIGYGENGLNVSGLQSDPTARIHLMDFSPGGYPSVAAAMAALTPDGNGGTFLPMPSRGTIDFVGMQKSAFTSSMFAVSAGWTGGTPGDPPSMPSPEPTFPHGF
jgi:hypothetical protein